MQRAETSPTPPESEKVDSVDISKDGPLKKAGQIARRVGRWLAGAYDATKTAMAIAPTLGHLVIARELARLEGFVTGKEPMTAIDYLRARAPGLYSRNISGLLDVASGPSESMGLSLDSLLEVERHFYQVLAPVKNATGIKQVPPFIRELAEAPFRPPGTPYSAFVFLGDQRKADAAHIMTLWNSPDRPPVNPFDETDDRHRIWQALGEMSQENTLPVFVDLDNNAFTYTGTEFMAKRTLASMVERNNNFGDGFLDAGLYYSWLTTRLDSYYKVLEPWLRERNPELVGQTDQIKTALTPPWLGGSKSGLGPWPSTGAVGKALDIFRELGKKVDYDKETAEGLCAFADAAVTLDRDLLTGVQTHWIKLLREVGHEGRHDILKPLQRAWIHLNIIDPSHPDFDLVSPAQAPLLEVLEGPPPVIHRRPYDRSLAIGEVVDHSLDGLGISERRAYVTETKAGIAAHKGNLERRELRVREAVPNYGGLDIGRVLRGEYELSEVNERLKELKASLNGEELPRDQNLEVHRHYAILDWYANADRRYGDVDIGLLADAPLFRESPLAVSEYYQPGQTGYVSMFPPEKPAEVKLAEGQQEPKVMNVSQVFEGGGGRGFAYVECLKQLHESLEKNEGLFRIDEFVGTSAGSITAMFRAAGFQPNEMRGVLERVDFKEFNSDAIWLMGGVDPKVRGVNRTGIFSMQKMYKTVYQLLSEKLGIEGRPILFRDLPNKLKLVTIVLNTDLPEDDPLRQLIADDGRFVMSSETTPNFDVVGAVLASSAVPGYFHSPQMEVARAGTDDEGNQEIRRYRMQFSDGGVVDNLSISSATKDSDKRALLVLPAHYQTVDPETGEVISLDTLNFDTSNLDKIDEHNKMLYRRFTPQLSELLHQANQLGTERTVMAFNLGTDSQQKLPALLGSNYDQTEELHQLAELQGFARLSMEDSRAVVDSATSKPGTFNKVLGFLFDRYVDGVSGEDNGFEPTHDGGKFHPGTTEEEDILDIGRSAGACALANTTEEFHQRRFETPPNADGSRADGSRADGSGQTVDGRSSGWKLTS
ncbi:MAG: patatin-like phospholipase family protein [Vulcanimicrobiota bacterium]